MKLCSVSGSLGNVNLLGPVCIVKGEEKEDIFIGVEKRQNRLVSVECVAYILTWKGLTGKKEKCEKIWR